MTTATKSPGAEKIGGQYEWELGADGKYIIKNVEVFSSHAFGENGVNYEVTDDWIDEAHKKLLENAPKNLIPVNYSVEHRSETKKHLGFLMPTTTRRIKVNGKVRNTMLGNVVGIEPVDFEDFKRTKYPFRSAQIVSFKQHRLRCLDMLREDPGFFEYDILTLKDKAESPLVAYHAAGEDGGDFLYAFGGNDKKKKDKGKSSDKKKSVDGKDKKDDKKEGDSEPGFGDDEKDGAEGEEGDEDGEGDGEGEEEVQESATDGMSTDEKIDKIFAMVMQLMKDSCPNENDVNGNKSPSQDAGSKKTYSAKEEEAVSEPKVDKKEAAPVAPETKDAVKSEAHADAKYAALAEKTEKALGKIEAKEREDKAVAELEGAGYRLAKATREKIATYAAKGEESLKDFVETFKLYAEKDPPADAGTGGAATTAAKSDLPDEVASYAAKNPQDKAGIAMRVKMFPEYEAYKAQGGTIPTFDRYVAAEVAASGYRMTIPTE